VFDILDNVLTVLIYPLLPSERIFWLYLATSLWIAFGVYVLARVRSGASLSARGFARFCFPRAVWRTPSAWLDVRYFLIHQTLRVWIYGGLKLAVVVGAYRALSGTLVAVFGQGADSGTVTLTDQLVVTLIAMLALDGVSYGVHYLQHKLPLLWEFHKVHHSLRVMNPLSNYREHGVDNLLYALATGVAGGAVAALVFYLRGHDSAPVVNVLGVNVLVFVFNAAGYNLRHSHIWVAWPGWLGYVLGSPAHHQVHHSCLPQHVDRNFAFMFPLWDWMFGTLHLPREPEPLEFGLGDGTEDDYTSVTRLYVLPFVRVYQRWSPALTNPRRTTASERSHTES